jgi:hypothetical protein
MEEKFHQPPNCIAAFIDFWDLGYKKKCEKLLLKSSPFLLGKV